MKKTAAVLLTLLLLFSLVPFSLAEDSGPLPDLPEEITEETISKEAFANDEEAEEGELPAGPNEATGEETVPEAPDGLSGEETDAATSEIEVDEPDAVLLKAEEGEESMPSKDGKEVPIDAKHFPDPVFLKYVAIYDSDKDGLLSEEEIARFTSLNLSDEDNKGKLESLKGVEYLTNLQAMFISGNRVRELDISNNRLLQTLSCSNNLLTELDLSGNSVLRGLYCGGNQLTSLDLSPVPALQDLSCGSNPLTGLDLSHTPSLVTLFCTKSGIGVLDISCCPNLLQCYETGRVVVYSTYWDFIGTDGARLGVGRDIVILPELPHIYPVISRQPEDQSASGSQKVTFSVSAEGTDLNYQWQVSKDGGETWTDCARGETGSQTAELTVTVTYDKAGWKYRCLVYRRTDCLPSSAATIYWIPSISSQPNSVKAYQTQSVSFRVTAKGNDLSYRWQVSKDGGATWKYCTSSGYDTSTLRFTARYSYGGWMYRCVVSNPGGSVISKERQLLVYPTVYPIEDQTVVAGDTVTLYADARGDGVTYQWQVNKTGSWKNCTSAGNDSATFSFTAKESYSGWKYRCVVTNRDCKDNTGEALLTVLPKATAPVVLDSPSDQIAAEGSRVTLSARAAGRGLTYQWQVNKTGTWKNCSSSGSNQPTFSFTARMSYSGWQYRCVITNSYGKKTTKAFDLTVISSRAAPIIAVQPAERLEVHPGMTATLKVTAAGSGLTYQWQVKRNGTKTWENVTIKGFDKPVLSFTATKEESGTYRCVISNASGRVTSSTETLAVY